MEQKKTAKGKYGRHSSFHPERNARSSGSTVSRLLFGVVVLLVILMSHDRLRGRGATRQAPVVALSRQEEVPASPIPSPAIVEQTVSPAQETGSRQASSPERLHNNPLPTDPVAESLAQTAPEKSDVTVKYVMEMNRSNSFMGQGSINGKNVMLLADTGATHVVIPEKIAQHIGLKKGAEMLFWTAGGTVVHHATKLDRLTLGQIEVRNVAAVINPAMREDFVLLGMSALGLMDMEFEQKKLVLKYKPANVSEETAESPPKEEPFKRTVQECAGQGNKFDKNTLACLRGK